MANSFKEEVRDAIGKALPDAKVEKRGGTTTFVVRDETGHNANAADDRLRLLIERVERLEEERRGISEDIRDVFSEAKAVGYDPKVMRIIIRQRRMKPDDRQELEMLIETYANAVGMQASLPL